MENGNALRQQQQQKYKKRFRFVFIFNCIDIVVVEIIYISHFDCVPSNANHH